MNMKKIILLSTLLVAAAAFAQSEDYMLILKMTDGRTSSFNVYDIEEMTFGEIQPIKVAVNENDKGYGQTYTTDGGVTVINWPQHSDAQPVLEHAIRTVSLDGDGLTGYDYVVKFSYYCDVPVHKVELRMVQNGQLIFPWAINGDTKGNSHCIMTGTDTSSPGGEWKELTYDVSRAWEKVGFSQSKNKGQDMSVQLSLDGGTAKPQTFKIKDLRILPRTSKYCPEVNLDIRTTPAYGETYTDIDGGIKIDFPAQWNDNGTMKNLPEHVAWVSVPYLLPHTDYTLSFSYKVNVPLQSVWDFLFYGDYSNAGADRQIDAAPLVNEWKEVKVNCKDQFTNFNFWGVRIEKDQIRINFNPVTESEPMTLEIKDVKLIPNF